MRNEDAMGNVHYTCDSCGETIKRPGQEWRGEHDAPDVAPSLGNGVMSLRFDLCAPCLTTFVRALKINDAKRTVPLGPGRPSLGVALDALRPYDDKSLR